VPAPHLPTTHTRVRPRVWGAQGVGKGGGGAHLPGGLCEVREPDHDLAGVDHHASKNVECAPQRPRARVAVRPGRRRRRRVMLRHAPSRRTLRASDSRSPPSLQEQNSARTTSSVTAHALSCTSARTRRALRASARLSARTCSAQPRKGEPVSRPVNVQLADTRTVASSCSNFPLRSAQQGPSAHDSRRPQLQLTSTKTESDFNSRGRAWFDSILVPKLRVAQKRRKKRCSR